MPINIHDFCNVEDDEQGDGFIVTVWTVDGNPVFVHKTYTRDSAGQIAVAIRAAFLSWLRAYDIETTT
jgi:hypothetical protein